MKIPMKGDPAIGKFRGDEPVRTLLQEFKYEKITIRLSEVGWLYHAEMVTSVGTCLVNQSADREMAEAKFEDWKRNLATTEAKKALGL